jgi:hypothetical protein
LFRRSRRTRARVPEPNPAPRARITNSAREQLRVRFAGGGAEARGRGRPSVPETARRVRRACLRADAFASVPERAPAGESAHTARCPRRISRGKQTRHVELTAFPPELFWQTRPRRPRRSTS